MKKNECAKILEINFFGEKECIYCTIAEVLKKFILIHKKY